MSKTMQFESFRDCDCSKTIAERVCVCARARARVYCVVWSRAFARRHCCLSTIPSNNARSHFNKQKTINNNNNNHNHIILARCVSLLFLAICNYHLWFEWVFDWQWWKSHIFFSLKIIKNKMSCMRTTHIWKMNERLLVCAFISSHIVPCCLPAPRPIDGGSGMCIVIYMRHIFYYRFFLKTFNKYEHATAATARTFCNDQKSIFKISFFPCAHLFIFEIFRFFAKF